LLRTGSATSATAAHIALLITARPLFTQRLSLLERRRHAAVLQQSGPEFVVLDELIPLGSRTG
jgi:hypothetical protein